jgi:glucose dehydrogenase
MIKIGTRKSNDKYLKMEGILADQDKQVQESWHYQTGAQKEYLGL